MLSLQRRGFIRKGLQLASLPLIYPLAHAEKFFVERNNLKLSLNAYSFNAALSEGTLQLEKLFDYCAKEGFAAVDLTAYYIPEYPEVPSDGQLYGIKKMAHHRGLHISGTGVRNDFTLSDPKLLKQEIDLVKNWVVAAAKLGAPVVRVFAGPRLKAGESWEEKVEFVIRACKECASFAAGYGVIVALQNHNEFVQSAAQVDYIMERVDEDWFGLVLDIGSYSQHDPYEEISKNIRHAVNWQLKENVNHFGTQKPVDLKRLIALIRESNYQGYLPIETLGPGDPFEKVSGFLARVQEAMG
ncbi:sugar phosphate isomerase/epimerase family protein [Cyclobacterium sp.]|uniref:sugar phosphate isomerase/epimerase family protein n=1 Tax=Cyclobacterium sp. TaxID=1966343 RepID=UPI0019B50324|nr:sugar phosphate isomerase/epimerase family protein [Cyclobacterium sp.]MBD3626919.1 sugar phosphate isomerase/epimerase [Cyclobacterium sp.]